MKIAWLNSVRLALIFGLLTTVFVETADAAKKKNGRIGADRGKTLKAESGRKVSRELVFNGTDVNGRYHLAGGAVAKVEHEKKMNSLIGLRGNFNDRLADERERLKQGESASAQ